MEFPQDVMIEGVAVAVSRFLADTTIQERIVTRMAELQTELMTPLQAATMLGVSKKTLQERAVHWGLDKSLLMGANEPRYYRSQVMKMADERRVKGRERSTKNHAPRTFTASGGVQI